MTTTVEGHLSTAPEWAGILTRRVTEYADLWRRFDAGQQHLAPEIAQRERVFAEIAPHVGACLIEVLALNGAMAAALRELVESRRDPQSRATDETRWAAAEAALAKVPGGAA